MATNIEPRKKSPRAPTFPLDEALEKTLKIYDRERLHATPTDVAAQHMGYKSANNGTALSALACVRYFGLVERPSDGVLAVNKDVEAYRYAPTEEIRRGFLMRFLRTPPLFAELLDKYPSGFPSDGNLKYELIQRGFMPATAESLVDVFKKSVDFAGVFSERSSVDESFEAVRSPQEDTISTSESRPLSASSAVESVLVSPLSEEVGHDRIPVRLPGGRRAWLLIPPVFYETDKQRLKAQIDLLLTEDEEI